jgi:hypothetical protein
MYCVRGRWYIKWPLFFRVKEYTGELASSFVMLMKVKR